MQCCFSSSELKFGSILCTKTSQSWQSRTAWVSYRSQRPNNASIKSSCSTYANVFLHELKLDYLYLAERLYRNLLVILLFLLRCHKLRFEYILHVELGEHPKWVVDRQLWLELIDHINRVSLFRAEKLPLGLLDFNRFSQIVDHVWLRFHCKLTHSKFFD